MHRTLLNHLPAPARVGIADAAALDARLEEILREASAAWPASPIAAETFVAYLAERLPPDRPCQESLARLAAADLYLACGCARGEDWALAAFDAQWVPRMRAALQSASPPGAAVDDLVQTVRERLLVGDGERGPRIGEYAGRGPLSSWLKVVGLRTAVSAYRKGRRETPATSERLAHLLEKEHDPELRYLKDIYREGFRAALQAAIEQLGARERNLLRTHYLDGLTLEEVGAFYGVHRATVARWIARAREQLLAGTLSALREHLQVSQGEFESLVRLLRSQVDLSVQRLFKGE